MTNKIFLYGTLIDAALETPYFKKLGNDKLTGTLYNVGWFPAARLTRTGTIKGVVFKINGGDNDILALLWYLDNYEGVNRGLYQRIEIKTKFGLAWIYEAIFDTDDLEVIKHGDWRKYQKNATKKIRTKRP